MEPLKKNLHKNVQYAHTAVEKCGPKFGQLKTLSKVYSHILLYFKIISDMIAISF